MLKHLGIQANSRMSFILMILKVLLPFVQRQISHYISKKGGKPLPEARNHRKCIFFFPWHGVCFSRQFCSHFIFVRGARGHGRKGDRSLGCDMTSCLIPWCILVVRKLLEMFRRVRWKNMLCRTHTSTNTCLYPMLANQHPFQQVVLLLDFLAIIDCGHRGSQGGAWEDEAPHSFRRPPQNNSGREKKNPKTTLEFKPCPPLPPISKFWLRPWL